MAVGFKPAGGIAQRKQSLEMGDAAEERNWGKSWLDSHFSVSDSQRRWGYERQREIPVNGGIRGIYRHPIA